MSHSNCRSNQIKTVLEPLEVIVEELHLLVELFVAEFSEEIHHVPGMANRLEECQVFGSQAWNDVFDCLDLVLNQISLHRSHRSSFFVNLLQSVPILREDFQLLQTNQQEVDVLDVFK